MPLARMLVHEDAVMPADMLEFSAGVREVIANALMCNNPDGALDPDADIELVIENLYSFEGDHTPCDVSVSIEAMDFPERVANKAARARQILEGVKSLLPEDYKVGIWLDLKPAEWVSA